MAASGTSYPEWHQDVPVTILEDLRCDICHKYLSVFPVHMSPSLGTICGRCPITEEDLRDAMRNTTYEKAVELSRFPCCNDEFGCVEKLTPSAISAHEKICKFRQVKCLCIQAECDWKGPRTSLVNHFEDKHQNFLMKQPDFEVNFMNTLKEVYMLVRGEGIFLFQKEANENGSTFQYSMEYFGLDEKPEDFSYQITMRDMNKRRSMMYSRKPAIKLDENVTKIVAENVRDELDNPSVIVGNIEITSNNATDQNEKESVYVKEKEALNNNMLKILECPVCLQYMTEIFLCRGGHSICKFCRIKITECPLCKQQINKTRNFLAESILSLYLYPCKYATKGCEFTIEGSRIKWHEDYGCEFRTVLCPFNSSESCDYEGPLNSMTNHTFDRHKKNVLESDVFNYQTLRVSFKKEDNCHLLKYFDEVFILYSTADEDACRWSLHQLLGSSESVSSFKLEIEIIDKTNSGHRIYLRGPCDKFTNYKYAFSKIFCNYLEVSYAQARRMINYDDRILTCKIRVVKKVH